MAYDPFDATDAELEWAELDQLIQDEIDWTVHMDDEMSEVDLSEDEGELSETEALEEWVKSDSDYDPAEESEQSDCDSWISDSAEMEM